MLWFDIYGKTLVPEIMSVCKMYAEANRTYGLLICGTADETNMTRIEAVRRRTLQAVFSKKIDSSESIFTDHQGLTVSPIIHGENTQNTIFSTEV